MTDQRVGNATAVLWDVAGGTALVLTFAAVSVGIGTVFFRVVTAFGHWTTLLIERFEVG
jgi:hypothetical protein